MNESVYFSLNNQIPQEKIINSINGLVSKNIKSTQEAESTILVIKLQKISQTYDQEVPKLQ
jgi:hypothetical protein